MRDAVGLVAGMLTAAASAATFCNPLDISYRFSQDSPSHREAADPTMVIHNGTYWLFASKSGGYWYSMDDMNSWEFVTPTGLPLETYAPMVVVIRERWYYTAFDAKAMYTTDDPYRGNWTIVTDKMNPYPDPGMLVDDDGKVYMYSGCSSDGEIKAVELDPQTWEEVGEAVTAVEPDYAHRGFEVAGDNNDKMLQPAPYVEGAWMNKLNGSYYLQYAVPGTQYKSYADGLFVGESPLGPFKFESYSPMSSKPSGFAAGAGHSSTFGAPNQLYHIATSSISVRAKFERRLGVYRTLLVEGRLMVDTYLGDYPRELPPTGGSIHEPALKLPKWMLLTYKKSVTASSTLSDKYKADFAVDEDIRTWWSAKTAGPEWLMVDLGTNATVNALQVNFADQDASIIGERPSSSDAYRWKVEYIRASGVEASGAPQWIAVSELDLSNNTQDRPHHYVELSTPIVGVAAMRITSIHMPGGAKFSISGFRAFGTAAGEAPMQVSGQVHVKRQGRQANVSWAPASGAEFYIIRFGVLGQESFHNVQMYPEQQHGRECCQAEINSLVDGVDYDFVIDSVNGAGVTLGGSKHTSA